MKTAKLFQNGQSQAVRLPKEFRFKGNEVIIKKVGGAVILLPKDNPWQPFLDSLKKFKGKIDREQPKGQQEREWSWR